MGAWHTHHTAHNQPACQCPLAIHRNLQSSYHIPHDTCDPTTTSKCTITCAFSRHPDYSPIHICTSHCHGQGNRIIYRLPAVRADFPFQRCLWQSHLPGATTYFSCRPRMGFWRGRQGSCAIACNCSGRCLAYIRRCATTSRSCRQLYLEHDEQKRTAE